MSYRNPAVPEANVHVHAGANIPPQQHPDVQHYHGQENVQINPAVVDVHGAAPGVVHEARGVFSSMFLDIEAERGLIDTYCWMVIVAAAVIYVLLHFLPSAYGRYASRAFGILIPAQIAWFLQDIPAVIIPILVLLNMERTQMSLANYVFLGLFVASYFQRAVIYPLLIKGGKPVPSMPFLMATAYNAINGYVQARYLTRFVYYGPLYILSVNFIAGLTMFAMGLFINLQSDSILRNLRSSLARGSNTIDVADDSRSITEVFDKDMGTRGAGPGGAMPTKHMSSSRTAGGSSEGGGYQIPYGGMFQYVSCANFFGEIVEWWGFAMATWSFPALAHAIFTLGNLVPRGLQHHQDYLTKFREDYPKSRSAVIPFII